MKVTLIHSKQLLKWLNETDPKKLHVEATKLLKQLESLVGKEDIGEAINVVYNTATFLETRAIYLLLTRFARRANVL